MKKNIYYKNTLISSTLVILATILLLSSLIHFENFLLSFRLFFIVYGITELFKYFEMNKKGEYTNAFGFFISSILLITTFIINMNSNLTISIIFIIFLTVLSLTRLKRADYYHDRKNKIWMVEIALLIIYALSGVLTSIHFNTLIETKILVLGYHTLICGIIEVSESIILYATKGKLK